MPVLPISPELTQILTIISVLIVLGALAFAMLYLFKKGKKAEGEDYFSTKVPDLEAATLQATEDEASLELFKTLLNHGEEEEKKGEMPTSVVKSFQNYACSDLIIQPQSAAREQAIEVSCRVTNMGKEEDSFNIELKIDSMVVSQQQVKLSPGSSRVVAFCGAENRPGEHLVEIEQLKGQFSVH